MEAEVKFTYEGSNTNIQCNINDKIKDIINKFLTNINKDENNKLYYLYNGNKRKEELTFNELANQIDKNRKKMNILVYNNIEDYNKKNEIISKDIICLDCKEDCLMDIKDFKISFNKCKNNHTYKDILLNYFDLTQKIDLNEIICDICNNQNMGNNHNNEFYICNNCNKNICPLCKSVHDKNHTILNYNDKNYICKKHNDTFTKFCKTCNENICIICEDEHNNHDIMDLSKILIKKDDFNKILKELKESIDKYKHKINIIKEIFDKMINIMDMYYKINYDINENYNMNKRNYYKLLNIYNLKNNNEILIKDINNIIKNDNISEIFKYSFDNFYNENGEKYIGEIKNGLKDGRGILYYNKDNEKKRKLYEGEFKNDKVEGKGKMYWINGNKYYGEWINDKKEGKGILYYNNGDKFEGNYLKGQREGKGIFNYNDGARFEGEWKNGKIEGKGTYFYNNGDRYECYFLKGNKEVKGIFYYNNGDRYEGDFVNVQREGKGICYYNNGDKFEGEWKNDKKEGKGIMYYNDGNIKTGEWKNDEFQKKGFFNLW